MIDSILRLFALRPLLTIAIMGIPLLVLIVIGLAAVIFLKLFIFFILPIAAVVWLMRRVFRSSHEPKSTPVADAEPVATA